jgi:hypothetical protein
MEFGEAASVATDIVGNALSRLKPLLQRIDNESHDHGSPALCRSGFSRDRHHPKGPVAAEAPHRASARNMATAHPSPSSANRMPCAAR